MLKGATVNDGQEAFGQRQSEESVPQEPTRKGLVVHLPSPHPKLSMRMPEPLQLARAAMCSDRWYVSFKQFLGLNNVYDPTRIWNANVPFVQSQGKSLHWLGQEMFTKLLLTQKSKSLLFVQLLPLVV